MRTKNVWTAISILGVWAAVATASIFAPDLSTDRGDTLIPLAAIISPIFGAVATAFIVAWAMRD
jgi:hypothetical protein